MSSTRVWTPESIEKWQDEREKSREKAGLKAFSSMNSKEKGDALNLEKEDIKKRHFNSLTKQAWRSAWNKLDLMKDPVVYVDPDQSLDSGGIRYLHFLRRSLAHWSCQIIIARLQDLNA